MTTRRRFLGRAAVLGATAVLAASPRTVRAQPRLETTHLRLGGPGGTCNAPKWVAEELLRSEGFTRVDYAQIELSSHRRRALNSGELDFDLFFAPDLIIAVDEAQSLTILAGSHVGCLEIVGTERVRTIRDLKGRAIAVRQIGETEHQFLAMILSYIGLDANKDVRLVAHRPEDGARLLADGKVDALIGFPPRPQELRAKNIGHVVLNGTTDPPWRDHFCCMVAGNREFVRRHPVATKRALRALMKANDVCAIEPARAAGLVTSQSRTSYDYALQTMKELPYARWRDYDAEGTIRFYALRLHEAGLIKSSPQKILAQGTDWRFLNELKRELK